MKTIMCGPASRSDFLTICDMVKPGSRVLDVGCSDGFLLQLLTEKKQVDGRGIELSQAGVNESVKRGLPVIQGDADTDLVNYPDQAFDFVILSQTLQATRQPKMVLEHLLRIGKSVIVSIPNFGNWRNRLAIGFTGRMPVNKSLPYSWYDTPNIHFCTIRDFIDLCEETDAKIEQMNAYTNQGIQLSPSLPLFFANFFAGHVLFLLSKH